MQNTVRCAVSYDRETAPDTARVLSARLWAAVDLPFLALEALSVDAGEFAVVTEASHRGEIVYLASESARLAGIESGMHVNAVLTMCSGIRVLPRDPDAEHDHLIGLRRWASCFTPTITTEPPTMLLFEISASLKLFGGTGALYGRLQRELGRSNYHCHLAITPTPGASSALASAGRETLITDMAGLRASMHGLPTRFLGLPRETLRRLQAAGIFLLEELWRLPRPDLARRFGPALVRKLDQILGTYPDPRRIDTAPVRFERCCELDVDTVETGFILRAARFLLEQFAGFLVAGNAVAGDILILLEHMDKPATRIDVGTRLPMRNADQWERLLGEHIGRRELRAPVVGIRLSGSASRDTTPVSEDLFQFPDTTRDWAYVLDELEARLGKKCLWMPGVAADHRPEYAWQPSPPGYGGIVAPELPDRPLWLLRTPLHLDHPDDPVSGPGPMDIVDGPERIESGWWDDNEYCRDYYTAVCPQGRHLWIFRDLKQKSDWYLHGLFG